MIPCYDCRHGKVQKAGIYRGRVTVRVPDVPMALRATENIISFPCIYLEVCCILYCNVPGGFVQQRKIYSARVPDVPMALRATENIISFPCIYLEVCCILYCNVPGGFVQQRKIYRRRVPLFGGGSRLLACR